MIRAAQALALDGPRSVAVRSISPPVPAPDEVLIEVHAVGVAFPDLLQSRGAYQLRAEPPFTLGIDLAGTVATAAHGFQRGQRVAAVVPHGAAAELVAVRADCVLPLPEALPFDEAAAIPANYLTADFALRVRGQLRPGQTVVVHGASGGVGIACLQVAKGRGSRTIAVVSNAAKEEAARAAGADEVVRTDDFRSGVERLGGADLVVDVVGGPLFTDSLRVLNEQGRLLVVGFAAGQGIPEVRVNRLLLGNIDVRGVGWGEFALHRPGYVRSQWDELLPMIGNGTIRPLIGARYPLEDFGWALAGLEARRAVGKTVVVVR